MNKQVKKFRTTVRNKQTHAVTAAYTELDTTYKLIESRQHELWLPQGLLPHSAD